MARAVVSLVAGVLLVLASLQVPHFMRLERVHGVLVDARVADCGAHADGPEDFNRGTLKREFHRLERNLQPALLALGLALAALGAARCVPRWRQASAVPGLTVVTAALGLGLFEAADQGRLFITAIDEGLFTEDEAAHLARFFDHAVPAARVIAAEVPEHAGFLYIDFDDRMTVYKAGYLLFPRRMFHLPPEIGRLDATTFRALAAKDPAGIERLRERGITHVVDFKQLTTADDPSAVISLEESP